MQEHTHTPAQVSNKRSQTNAIDVCEEQTKFNTDTNLWKVDAEVDGIREEAIVHLFFTALHFQCHGATGRDP